MVKLPLNVLTNMYDKLKYTSIPFLFKLVRHVFKYLYTFCTDKYMQNYVKIPILESILDKTVGNVLHESKQLRNKSDVHHYTGCIAS